MILSKNRAKGAVVLPQQQRKEERVPDLDEFLARRDYVGAITLLQHATVKDAKTQLWLAYSYFHFGEHQKALTIYQDLLRADDADPELRVYAAACLYYMGRYPEAEQEASAAPRTPLANRILFHCAHKAGNEARLMTFHGQLSSSVEDQLSLASTHFLRAHLQEATDVYKRLLLENKEYLALHVYTALCYAKLDYYDTSNEILSAYLAAHPDSALATNLKACNAFRLFNGKAAEAELAVLGDVGGGGSGGALDNDLIAHNLVVFRQGDGALQRLPPLQDIIPEAKLNLVIHYLRTGDVREAHELVKNMEPQSPQEYILKAVVHASLGQSTDNSEHLKIAQQYYQLVGSSESECDTIPGRQCMASAFFLAGQFDDVLVYLKSIKQYFQGEDDFHWNYGIANAASGKKELVAEAEEAFNSVKSERLRTDYLYLAWLARTLIAAGKPRAAWDLYTEHQGPELFGLLQLIAHDCYRKALSGDGRGSQGAFLTSARAFDVLERMEPNPTFWEGKRGACAGVFRNAVANKEPAESVREVVGLLRGSPQPEAETMVHVMRTWAAKNGVKGV